MDYHELVHIVENNEKRCTVYPIHYTDIVCEERVKLNCFYCKKYNRKWTCPPHIPSINYKLILKEYDHLAIIKYETPFTEDTYAQARYTSTNDLHKLLLKLEKHIYENNNSLAVTFIGGSCKLCKNDCDHIKCRNPHLARIPVEAFGINVIAK